MKVVDRIFKRNKKETKEEPDAVTQTVNLTGEEWAIIQKSIDAGESAYNALPFEAQVNMLDFLRVAFPDEKIENVDDGRNFIKAVVKDKTLREIADNFKEAERLMGLGKAVLKANEKLGSRFDVMIIKSLEKIADGKVQLDRVPTSEDAANVENMVKEARDAFFEGYQTY